MITHRLYLAVTDAEGLSRLFLQDERFVLLGAAADYSAALRDICTLSPDLALVDTTLCGGDGFSLLDELAHALVAPPRILFLQRLEGDAWCKAALHHGADNVIHYPCPDALLLPQAIETAMLPLPALAQKSEAARLACSGALLERLGVSARLKGFSYLQQAAAWGACAPQLLTACRDRLYPALSGVFHSSPAAIEKAIRTAIEATWLHGDLSAITALFGLSVDADKGKPTNAACIAMLSTHIRNALEKEGLIQ